MSRVGRSQDALSDLVSSTCVSESGAIRPENFYNLGLGCQSRQLHLKAIAAFTTCLELLQQHHLSPPWNEQKRLDAAMYLVLRKATYKSRSLSLRQERQYRDAAMDMIRCGGSSLKALPMGYPGSYNSAIRKGVACYYDCGDLFASRNVPTKDKEEEQKDVNEKVSEEMKGKEKEKEKGADLLTTKTEQNQHNGSVKSDNAESGSESDTSSESDSESENELLLSSSTGIWHQLAEAASHYHHHTESDLDKLVDVLQEVHMLHYLPKKHLRRIAKHVKIIKLHQDQAVFYQSSTAHCMYVILHGAVSVHLREKVQVKSKANATNQDSGTALTESTDEFQLADREINNKEPGINTSSMDGDSVTTEIQSSSTPPSPPHLISWEEQHYHHNQPNNRQSGTLSTTGGKYLVTLHVGQAFGEQALANSDEKHVVSRSASCVSEVDDTILMTISKHDFDRIVKTELKRETMECQHFLQDVSLFTMVKNDRDMHNIAMYAETREYSVDDVIVAEGTEQEEG